MNKFANTYLFYTKRIWNFLVIYFISIRQVFHVCALTDDGLIMKSFLCPESTLFDMTILKCNWWFYTDCKYAKKLYDSNIPISKSYQLIKALTFFSNYKKEAAVSSTTTSTTTSTERSTITKDWMYLNSLSREFCVSSIFTKKFDFPNQRENIYLCLLWILFDPALYSKKICFVYLNWFCSSILYYLMRK